MKITPNRLKEILQYASDEINNFSNEVYSKPDDFNYGDTQVLLDAIHSSQEALLDYEEEEVKGNKWIDIDPILTERILKAISTILEKRSGEHVGSFQVALNSLIEFQNDIRDIERRRKDEKNKKIRAQKIENDPLL